MPVKSRVHVLYIAACIGGWWKKIYFHGETKKEKKKIFYDVKS
jgi:hypothetical protein